MAVPRRTKARFIVLTIGRFVIGAAALFRSLELFGENSLALALVVFCFGLVLLWWGIVGFRVLFGARDPLKDAYILENIKNVETRAPSGLRPLWMTLLAILGVFFAFIVVTLLSRAS